MNTDFFKASVVLLASGHNPTILHPSFLKNEKIVPQDWELYKEPICTPPFANVTFTSGFSFVVEQNRLQIVYNGENADQKTKTASEMGQKYVKKLPYVHYTSVGINFTSFYYPLEEPTNFIIKQFIKEGHWDSDDYKLSSTKLSFSYNYNDYQLNIIIEPGQKQIKEEQKGIFLHANYHADCEESDLVGSAKNLLNQIETKKEHFKYTAKLFLGEGEE